MGPRIGLIAGSGELPSFVLEEAKKRGLFCAVLAVRGEASAGLRTEADAWREEGPGQLAEVLSFFRANGVRDIVFAGKVDPSALFRAEDRDAAAQALLAALPDKRPASLIRRAIDFLAGEGFRVIDPAPFLEPHLCPEGILTPQPLPDEVRADIDFGWPLARTIADQDIGQTIVVKSGMVVAVEGLEGTDAVIRRAGELAGPGAVVIKISRAAQESRVDVPGAGPVTVESLIAAKASALCLEAGRVLLFRRPEAVALAARAGVALVGRRP